MAITKPVAFSIRTHYPYIGVVSFDKWQDSIKWLANNYGTQGSKSGTWDGEWVFEHYTADGDVKYRFKQEQVCSHFILMWA